MGKRTKDPYMGMYNLVGEKIEKAKMAMKNSVLLLFKLNRCLKLD